MSKRYKYKILYRVQDRREDVSSCICFSHRYCTTDTKICRTLKRALRCAIFIENNGGVPLISKRIRKNHAIYWQDYRLKNKKK